MSKNVVQGGLESQQVSYSSDLNKRVEQTLAFESSLSEQARAAARLLFNDGQDSEGDRQEFLDNVARFALAGPEGRSILLHRYRISLFHNPNPIGDGELSGSNQGLENALRKLYPGVEIACSPVTNVTTARLGDPNIFIVPPINPSKNTLKELPVGAIVYIAGEISATGGQNNLTLSLLRTEGLVPDEDENTIVVDISGDMTLPDNVDISDDMTPSERHQLRAITRIGSKVLVRCKVGPGQSLNFNGGELRKSGFPNAIPASNENVACAFDALKLALHTGQDLEARRIYGLLLRFPHLDDFNAAVLETYQQYIFPANTKEGELLDRIRRAEMSPEARRRVQTDYGVNFADMKLTEFYNFIIWALSGYIRPLTYISWGRRANDKSLCDLLVAGAESESNVVTVLQWALSFKLRRLINVPEANPSIYKDTLAFNPLLEALVLTPSDEAFQTLFDLAKYFVDSYKREYILNNSANYLPHSNVLLASLKACKNWCSLHSDNRIPPEYKKQFEIWQEALRGVDSLRPASEIISQAISGL